MEVHNFNRCRYIFFIFYNWYARANTLSPMGLICRNMSEASMTNCAQIEYCYGLGRGYYQVPKFALASVCFSNSALYGLFFKLFFLLSHSNIPDLQ